MFISDVLLSQKTILVELGNGLRFRVLLDLALLLLNDFDCLFGPPVAKRISKQSYSSDNSGV